MLIELMDAGLGLKDPIHIAFLDTSFSSGRADFRNRGSGPFWGIKGLQSGHPFSSNVPGPI